MFRTSKMIGELRLVDSSGGVQEAIRAMGQRGTGLEVYGGNNRNYFTVGVPCGEYLTSQGTATFQVTYKDGTSERVVFHMAPPDDAKISRTADRLPNAKIFGTEEAQVTLAALLDNAPSAASETTSGTLDANRAELLPETAAAAAFEAVQKTELRQAEPSSVPSADLNESIRELQLKAYHIHLLSPNAAEALSRLA